MFKMASGSNVCYGFMTHIVSGFNPLYQYMLILAHIIRFIEYIIFILLNLIGFIVLGYWILMSRNTYIITMISNVEMSLKITEKHVISSNSRIIIDK